METIVYEGVNGVKHVVDGADVRYDAETEHWVLDRLVDRGGFTNVVHVPVGRVYSVRTRDPDVQPPSSTERFVDGTLTYEGPEGEETLRVGGLTSNTDDVLWYDAETDHWVARQAANDTSGAVVRYVPAHRVYSVAERVDLDGVEFGPLRE